jgi:Fur family peroxide stress response transcriptional regulator
MQQNGINNCLDGFIEHCKKHRLKITPQRCAIYREMIKLRHHPTIEEIFQAVSRELTNISYDTVNRTVGMFARIGLIDVVKAQSGPRRFDTDPRLHHHFYCLNCGTIIDFDFEDYDNLSLPEDMKKNHSILSKRVVLNGLCKNCREKKSPSSPPGDLNI